MRYTAFHPCVFETLEARPRTAPRPSGEKAASTGFINVGARPPPGVVVDIMRGVFFPPRWWCCAHFLVHPEWYRS